MTTVVELDIDGETFDVDVEIDSGEDALRIMEAVVDAGTDMPAGYIRALSTTHLAKLYSAVVTEMNDGEALDA